MGDGTENTAAAFLRAEAQRYDDEARAHRASHGRDESKSVRDKKRAQARALLRAADALVARGLDAPESAVTVERDRTVTFLQQVASDLAAIGDPDAGFVRDLAERVWKGEQHTAFEARRVG